MLKCHRKTKSQQKKQQQKQQQHQKNKKHHKKPSSQLLISSSQRSITTTLNLQRSNSTIFQSNNNIQLHRQRLQSFSKNHDNQSDIHVDGDDFDNAEPQAILPGERVFHRVELSLQPPKLDATLDTSINEQTEEDKKNAMNNANRPFVRPNPTLNRIEWLNKNLHIKPKPQIDDSKIPDDIPNLNLIDQIKRTDTFRTDPIPDAFDNTLFPIENVDITKNQPSLRKKYGSKNDDSSSNNNNNNQSASEADAELARKKAQRYNNVEDGDDDDYYGSIPLDIHLQRYKEKQHYDAEQIFPTESLATPAAIVHDNDTTTTSSTLHNIKRRTTNSSSGTFKSVQDEMYRYETQQDSGFFESVDPHENKKRRNLQEFKERERSKTRADRQEELEQQREEDEILVEDIDFVPLENDLENNITQVQALSAYIMQKKMEEGNFHPSQRPVFWHGAMPHAKNVAIQGLESFDKTMLNLDWRTFLDLSQPHLWYPTARLLKRKIILHCGPTNSGKTYRAMQRLKEANSGLYCGPLRLLAWENFEKLNASNVACSLLTGQEVIETPNAQHVSSTVEMVNLDRIVDVAVIDEIQMIQDRDRGHAWTRAFLGIPAKEVHLCGDKTSLSWLQEITKLTGEELHICEYNRLSPLTVQQKPLTGYKYLKKGDCVVAFSRNDVYAIKKKIEEETNRKVSIIYGNLPPDIRKEQARAFNDGESDVLVASDAIGMGLNLNIGRVIFSTIAKFDGEEFRRLSKTEVLQIAGRAGRFNTQFHNGQVTVMHVPEDLEYIREQFETPLPPMERAQLFPSTEHLLTFCEKFPTIKLSDYLRSLPTRAKVSNLFEISDVRNIADLAEICDDIPMPSYNRVMLTYVPLNPERYKSHRPLLTELATKLTSDDPIPVPKIAYCARPTMPRSPAEVALLEETFQNLEAYIWLWFRMGDQMYMHRQAKLDRDSCQKIILQYLQTNSHQFTKKLS